MSTTLLSGKKYESTTFTCTAHAHNISQKLQKFCEVENFSDIVFVADNHKTRVYAHRIVLSASSDYFVRILQRSSKNAVLTELKFIINDIDGETLKILLKFMYTGSVELRCETIETILKAAESIEMITLVRACVEFIEQRLDTANCLGIAAFAEQHSYIDLHQSATSFALRNFEKVSTENQFYQLSKNQLCALISSDDLIVSSEEKVFLSVVSWVVYDKANRETGILEILPMVRFASLDPMFIAENRLLVCKTIECYELICSWLQWHLSPENGKQETKHRKLGRKLAYISGEKSSDLKLQTFDPGLNSWSYITIPQLNVVKQNYRITYIYQKLIITGGSSNMGKGNSVECFDLLANKWTNLCSMGSARSLHEATAIDGHLYVLGGCENGFSVERYDFATDRWQYLKSLPQGFTNGFATVLLGRLYVISGPKVICYDCAANNWVTKNGKTTNIDWFGSAEVGGKLYLVGGSTYVHEDSCTVECFNFEKNRWELEKSLDLKRGNVHCTELNNRLIVAGGYITENKNFTNIVEEYDPKKMKWTKLAPLLPHNSSFYSDLLFTI